MPFGGGAFTDKALALVAALVAALSPMPFGGGAFTDPALKADGGIATIGGSPMPFGGGAFTDGERDEDSDANQWQSPMPFGGGAFTDVNRIPKSQWSEPSSHQCLSAGGPSRTPEESHSGLHAVGVSPMPFGGGAFTDHYREIAPDGTVNCHQCLSAGGPSRTWSSGRTSKCPSSRHQCLSAGGPSRT